MSEPIEPGVPFRWDLVTPDQLGSLLAGTAEADLWFLDDLVACAGKVLARSGHGDLMFVGRSLDSMFDLVSGVLADMPTDIRLARLPFSFAGRRGGGRPTLTPAERVAARRVLAEVGVTPHALARRRRPVTFVDVVHDGFTLTALFALLDEWVAESREPWDVVRRKLRFVGVTIRRKTSPHTWRWQQHAAWTGRLPAGAVVNVPLDYPVWSYFGDHQVKLTRSFHPERWVAAADGPGRDERTRQALAEAVALVAYGRTTAGRLAVARATAGEPALAEAWLRTLVGRLSRP